MLVFPTGAKVNGTSGLQEAEYKDGRRTIIFKDMEDVKTKENALRVIIKEWLRLVEKKE